jgi:hypothetical protein
MHSYVCRTLQLRGRDSSVVIATRYGLDGPGIESRCGDEIFRPRPYRPYSPPSLLYNGYRLKRTELGTYHPPSKYRGRESVGIYLYSPSGPQWPVIRRTFTFTIVITVPFLCFYIVIFYFHSWFI